MNIKDRIAQEQDAWRQMGHPDLLKEFLLRNGEEFKAAAFAGQRGTPKECFRNAALWVGQGTEYAEGFGWRAGLPIMIHHAWRVTDDGYVIDDTWDRPEECQYFGIRIPHKELWAELERLGHYGLLDTGRGLNIKFMLARDPGMKEFLK